MQKNVQDFHVHYCKLLSKKWKTDKKISRVEVHKEIHLSKSEFMKKKTKKTWLKLRN
jgi:hypothetical protein